MLIEIFTNAIPFQNGFALYRREVIDGEKTDLKTFHQADDQFQADLLNVGFALRSISEFDKKFGIVCTGGQKERRDDKDFKQLSFKENYRIFESTGERCDVIIYTENTELFENLKYSIRFYDNAKTRKYLTRVKELQLKTLVAISMPAQVLETWQSEIVKKYG